MQKHTGHGKKVKITLSLSRPMVATLDLIGAKRFEKGRSRSEVKHSVLVEEAIQLLKKKERL